MTTKTYSFPKVNYANSNPGVGSDVTKGYISGCVLVNELTGDKFFCLDDSVGAARWLKLPGYIDPLEVTTPNYQTDIDNAMIAGDVFITPQIYYQKDTVDYDVMIPVGNAMSAGPISIALTKTVSVSGTWTIV